jgi:hypothetical protein
MDNKSEFMYYRIIQDNNNTITPKNKIKWPNKIKWYVGSLLGGMGILGRTIFILLVCNILVIPSLYCGDVETVSGDAAVCTYWVEGVALVSWTIYQTWQTQEIDPDVWIKLYCLK